MSGSGFSLVLGGGGLKGIAHVGALQALEERGLEPSAVAGNSIGSLVAAAWLAGESASALRERAEVLSRRDVFQIAHFDMAFRRMLAPALYRSEPLETLITSLVGGRRFDELSRPLAVNTVDLNSGMQTMWGMPGMDDVRLADAVFASCALPGIFPPRQIRGRWFVDGAVVENLPITAVTQLAPGPVIAVDLGATGALREGVEREGFAATYVRGLEIVMASRLELQARTWQRPPVLFVTPRVSHLSMFSLDDPGALVEEGRRAMLEALDHLPTVMAPEASGIYPRHEVELAVVRERCIGCRLCAARAPEVFRMGADGIATVVHPRQVWSPMDGAYVRHCPTYAITARPVAAPPGTRDTHT